MLQLPLVVFTSACMIKTLTFCFNPTNKSTVLQDYASTDIIKGFVLLQCSWSQQYCKRVSSRTRHASRLLQFFCSTSEVSHFFSYVSCKTCHHLSLSHHNESNYISVNFRSIAPQSESPIPAMPVWHNKSLEGKDFSSSSELRYVNANLVILRELHFLKMVLCSAFNM